jgi:hypothetical protein
LKTVARELGKYKLDLVGVQEVRWDKGGTEWAEDYTFFYEAGNEDHQLGTGLFLYTGESYQQLTNSVAQEPKGSSPHSQQLATGSYPEPFKSNPHNPSRSPQDPFWSHPPIYTLVFRVVSFLRAFPPKPCTLICPLPCVPYVLPPSFALTWTA